MVRRLTNRKILLSVLIGLTLLLALVSALLTQALHSQKAVPFSAGEAAILAQIAGISPDEFMDITVEALSRERKEKFPAVSSVSRTNDGIYGFICRPIAYNGPVTLALVIDSRSGLSLGMRIIEHEETEHYVRDIENDWFTDRFAGKSSEQYLQPSRLEAHSDLDIVAITGATVTTEGIINGVNAAFGVFREFVLDEDAPAVPYMVRYKPGVGADVGVGTDADVGMGAADVGMGATDADVGADADVDADVGMGGGARSGMGATDADVGADADVGMSADGPEETGLLAVRVYGVVLGEISLEEIKELPSYRRAMSIHSSSGVTRHDFRGALLSDVLDLLDLTLKERYLWLRTVGVDEYMSDISMDEVRKENAVFLMYEDNGEPLPKRDGTPGAMRVVVIDDMFGQRFTNYLFELVLEGEVNS